MQEFAVVENVNQKNRQADEKENTAGFIQPDTAFLFESKATEDRLHLQMNYTVDFYGEVNQTKEMTVIVGKPVGERKE